MHIYIYIYLKFNLIHVKCMPQASFSKTDIALKVFELNSLKVIKTVTDNKLLIW